MREYWTLTRRELGSYFLSITGYVIMAAAVLLRDKANPTDADINIGMAGNVCRCGTYQRIRRAIHLAAQLKAQGGAK